MVEAKKALYKAILDVMEHNNGLCMDVPGERRKLARAIVKMLDPTGAVQVLNHCGLPASQDEGDDLAIYPSEEKARGYIHFLKTELVPWEDDRDERFTTRYLLLLRL